MADFNVRSDSVNVEQIMEQIRARIREKRGVDYTEQQIHELAAVKLERFLDPTGVRSDLLDQFRKAQPAYQPPELPNFAFEESTLFESHRAPIRWMRKLLAPLLKLLFNPNPLIQALNIQARLNTINAEREARREAGRRALDQLYYELIHNLVLETTRTGIEVKNLKMRLESVSSRLEFNERRARALEGAVVYKPAPEEAPAPPPRAPAPTAPYQQRSQPSYSRPSPPPPSASTSGGGRAGQGGRPGDAGQAGKAGQTGEPGRSGETGPAARPDAGQAAEPGPTAQPGQGAAETGAPGEGPGQRSRRRRRRRGRRGGGAAAGIMGAPGGSPAPGGSAPPADGSALPDDFDAADETSADLSDDAGDDAPEQPHAAAPVSEPPAHVPAAAAPVAEAPAHVSHDLVENYTAIAPTFPAPAEPNPVVSTLRATTEESSRTAEETEVRAAEHIGSHHEPEPAPGEHAAPQPSGAVEPDAPASAPEASKDHAPSTGSGQAGPDTDTQ